MSKRMNAVFFLAICLLCGTVFARTPVRAWDAQTKQADRLRMKASLHQRLQTLPADKTLSANALSGLAGKLDPRLMTAWKTASRTGVQAAVEGLKKQNVRLAENGQDVVVVALLADGADAGQVSRCFSSCGAEGVRTAEGSVKAVVPVGQLDQVALLDGVRRVRPLLPPRELNTSVSEGVSVSLAHAWQTAGLTGQGVKVAVVDVGFSNLTTLKAQDEIPSSVVVKNYSAEAMEGGSSVHGSACAEIIYDMAPGVQLYLIKIDDAADLGSAVSYCIENGISIVSCSLGWDCLNFHDGMAYANWFTTAATHPVKAVEDAAAAGILWVNAAGNEQYQQSVIGWTSSDSVTLDWDSDGYNLNPLYINKSYTVPANTLIDVIMTWNKWPTTNQDFDLYLVRWNGSSWVYDAGSEESQTGNSQSYPYEEIQFTTTNETEYAILIRKYSASTSPTFLLRYYCSNASGSDCEPYYFGHANYETPVPGSVVIPGDSASAFTVGALDFLKYTTGPIEYYSSLGPNNRAYTGGTAVPKPDICGPDCVTGASYGTENFAGTSAATPHVTALAALVKGKYPAYTSAQIRAYLTSHAYDLGETGTDNTYGAGAARLPTSRGTPASWLEQYGLVSGDDYETADTADTDGDGFSAWQEYVAGTVPTNGASVFYALMSRTNGQARIYWVPDMTNAEPTRAYSVYGTPSLTDGFPSAPFTNLAAGAAVTLPASSSNRFFKVGVELQ